LQNGFAASRHYVLITFVIKFRPFHGPASGEWHERGSFSSVARIRAHEFFILHPRDIVFHGSSFLARYRVQRSTLTSSASASLLYSVEKRKMDQAPVYAHCARA